MSFWFTLVAALKSSPKRRQLAAALLSSEGRSDEAEFPAWESGPVTLNISAVSDRNVSPGSLCRAPAACLLPLTVNRWPRGERVGGGGRIRGIPVGFTAGWSDGRTDGPPHRLMREARHCTRCVRGTWSHVLRSNAKTELLGPRLTQPSVRLTIRDA